MKSKRHVDAGRLGGLANVQNNGVEQLRRMGKKGGDIRWAKVKQNGHSTEHSNTTAEQNPTTQGPVQ